ncbi:MAG: DUF5522 domain-containing protein [Microthrixaceae bacterium]
MATDRSVELSEEITAVHDLAVSRGAARYEDPETGFVVMTAATLAAREECCGNDCRHCPY